MLEGFHSGPTNQKSSPSFVAKAVSALCQLSEIGEQLYTSKPRSWCKVASYINLVLKANAMFKDV